MRLKTDRQTLNEYFWTFFGSSLTAFGVGVFLAPAVRDWIIPGGGLAGISTIVNYLNGFPIGTLTIILNVPLLYFGWKTFGQKFVIRTIVGALVLGLMIDFFREYLKLSIIPDDKLLSAICGGLCTGTGQGLVLRNKGTTGGMDIVAKLVNHYHSFPPGHILMTVNALVIITGGIVSHNVTISLYSLFAAVTNARLIDVVIEGITYNKAIFIITEQGKAIGDVLLRDINRSATIIHGQGVFTRKSKEILFCVVGRGELAKVRDIARAIDPESFVTVMNVREVRGEGFSSLYKE